MMKIKRIFFGIVLVAIALVQSMDNEAYGFEYFADGNYVDHKNEIRLDTFYGGFDMDVGDSPNPYMGSTKIGFTLGVHTNNIWNIYGGGRSRERLPSIIEGDTTILVCESIVRGGIFGGGVSNVDPNGRVKESLVMGKANIGVWNSRINTIFGSGDSSGPVRGQSSVGGVDIVVDKSTVVGVFGTSLCGGLQNEGGYAVTGDVNIRVQNHSNIGIVAGTLGDIVSPCVKGDVAIDVRNSKVREIACIGTGALDGHCRVYIGDKAEVTVVHLTRGSSLGGSFSLVVNDAIAHEIHIGQPGTVQQATVSVQNGGKVNCFGTDNYYAKYQGRIEKLDVDVAGDARIDLLSANAGFGSVGSYEVAVREGGRVRYLSVGYDPGAVYGLVDEITINLAGGAIGWLDVSSAGVNKSTLRVSGGNRGIIGKIPRGEFTRVLFEEGSCVRIGRSGEDIVLSAEEMELSGVVGISANAKIHLVANGSFIANGGMFDLEDLLRGGVADTPGIVLSGAVRNGITVIKPLSVNVSALAPYMRKGLVVPIAQVQSADFARIELFESTRKGLLWGDIAFDSGSNTWNLKNIRPSQGYYGYTAGRKASSWMREQSIESLHERSRTVLLGQHRGLWVDAQGGYEVLGSSVGQSKMPWGMASIGYDDQNTISKNVSGAYGGGIGVSKGWNKWNEGNTTKNTIQMAFAKCYGGFSYSGVYSIVGIQVAVGEVQSTNHSFDINRQWSEVVPTESLEVGWNYGLGGGVSVTPRGKVLIEQLSERKSRFTVGGIREEVTLKSSTNITTIAGIGVSYDIGIKSTLGISADWIRGIKGGYTAYSKVFSSNFVEEKKDNVIRMSLEGDVYSTENIRIGMRIFGDVLDNKGLGAEGIVEIPL